MKGFFITINNGLLDPKHREGINEAVWLFMWLIDKMTIINHDTGVGEVLGGKPIKFEEVEEDLGISRATYKRWITILKKGRYIATIRTPHGLKISVFKAKKKFGRSIKREPSDSSKVSHQMVGNEPSNKTPQLDTSVRHTKSVAPQDGAGKAINDLIDLFKAVNPNWERLFANKTERRAMERMVKKVGEEKIKFVIEKLPTTNKVPYAPVITTPYQLEKKLGNLIAFYQRKKAESETKGIKINTL